MRRSLLTVVVAVSLLWSAPTVAAAPVEPENPVDKADAALTAVRAVFRGEQPHLDATLALRDLFVALPTLDGADRQTANAYLARPTDGPSDRLGDGYAVPAKKRCRDHICLHWVPTTADAPPGPAWVRDNLAFLNRVWRFEVGKLGYRKPISDGKRGGNAKLDVYLKDVGSRGVYGYCAPERRAKGRKWLASGYCVLDNDFDQAQFGAPPRDSMRVTAAHEFFHAVQFSYDYGEDPWLMEATATWMEERVADSVNDNRQYLPHGQVGRPAQSLDRFSEVGFNQYGNWAYFEYLTSRYGAGVVRSIWNRAGEFRGAGFQYSTAAVKSVLAKRGGFVKVFRAYTAGNAVPARTYGEGRAWDAAPANKTWVLTTAERRSSGTGKIDHLASHKVQVRPGRGVKARGWKLRLAVNGPSGRTSPAASVVVRRKDGVTIVPIPLDRNGQGHVVIPFGSRRVNSATVVLANASTRFSCWRRTTWSCQGRARDNNQRFDLTATALPPKKRR